MAKNDHVTSRSWRIKNLCTVMVTSNNVDNHELRTWYFSLWGKYHAIASPGISKASFPGKTAVVPKPK